MCGGKAERQRLNQREWEKEYAWAVSRNQIPRAADGEVCRSRLLSSLETGNEEIVVFRAGAGYGKTTVMGEWAQTHRARSCWYHLHESDNDVFRFLRGIAASFLCAGTENASDMDQFIKETWKDFFEMSETFFFCCFSALPAEEFYVCLDSFEVITDEKVQSFLLQFMEYGAGRVRFFFTARGGFPEFLAAGLMRGQVREIGAEELRFEEWETGLLLNRITGRGLPEHIAKSVQEYTKGWPAGVVFAARELKSGKCGPDNSVLSDRTNLYHYMFYEIFRKLSFDMQQFLLGISVFEKIEAAVCNYALKRTDAEGMLEYLVRENLFLTRSASEQRSYHCEQIFAGFLRERLPAIRRKQILLRAAEYYARRRNWEDAARYGMECGQKGCGIVAAIVEKQALLMYESGKNKLLGIWIDYLCSFREELTEAALFCIYGCLHREGKEEEAAEILAEAAEKAYQKQRFDLYETYLCELKHLRETEKSGKRQGLFVVCLGNFLVRGKNGELAWRTKKTKELFACLFHEEGRWTARDILMERLWPEKPAEKAVGLFHTTVSYLRKTLTENELADVLLSKNQSYAVDMEYITSDLGVLRRWYDGLRDGRMPEGENPRQLLEMHYRGYMYEEDYPWAAVYKEHVEQRYLWILRELAEQKLAEEKFISAAAYLRRAAEIDGYDISALGLLVKCLLLGGDLAGARREYTRIACVEREITGREQAESFESFVRKFSESKNF